MFSVTITEKGGSQTAHTFDKTEVTIGRVKGNDIVLPKGNVSKRHSRIVVKDGKFIIVDLKSTNGTYVNGRKISAPHVIKDSDKVYIGDFILTVKEESVSEPAPAPAPPPPPPPAPPAAPMASKPSFGRATGAPPTSPPGFGPPKGSSPGLPGGIQPNQMGGTGLPGLGRGPNSLTGPGPLGGSPASSGAFGSPTSSGAFGGGPKPSAFKPPPTSGHSGFSPPSPAPTFSGGPTAGSLPPAAQEPTPVHESQGPSGGGAPTIPPVSTPAPVAAVVRSIPVGRATLPPTPSLNPAEAIPYPMEVAAAVMEAFLERFDPRELPESYPPEPEIKQRAHQALQAAYDSIATRLPPGINRDVLIDSLLNEAVGLGPLEYYLDDDLVTDIHINGPSRLVLERNGQLCTAERTFTSADFLYLAALRLLSVQGYGSAPPQMSEVRFNDGTLVHIVLPPVAVGGPMIAVRKPRRRFATLDDLCQQGTLSPAMVEFLRQAIQARRTMIVAGPPSSGRTMFINALLAEVPDGARIIAVESTSMLQLPQHTALSFESQSSSPYGEAVELSALVNHAVRMRPERLVVDEIAGAEALGFLKATASGARGSIGVISAITAQDALEHLEQLALLAQNSATNTTALIRQIERSVDLVLCLHRFSDGSRRLVEVAEVSGSSPHHIETETIFRFENDGMGAHGSTTGRFVATGSIPLFYRALQNGGVQLNTQIFKQD